MTNAYCGLTVFKNRLDLTGTTNDARMRLLLQAVSRIIDTWTGRHFYAQTATRYFDGDSQPLRIDDLLSVTTLKTDEDGDATFENTFAVTDYTLYPISSPTGQLFPKTHIYLTVDSDYGSFAGGIRRGVEIAGLWGYGTGYTATPYVTSGTTLNEDISTSVTDFDLALGSAVEIGNTILLDSEQMYVTAVASNTITAVRAVNGTTAATHSTGATVYYYEYPESIREACLLTAARMWKRRDSAYSTEGGTPETGMPFIGRGFDQDVQLFLQPYRRILLGGA